MDKIKVFLGQYYYPFYIKFFGDVDEDSDEILLSEKAINERIATAITESENEYDYTDIFLFT